jgi:hypothetical protein
MHVTPCGARPVLVAVSCQPIKVVGGFGGRVEVVVGATVVVVVVTGGTVVVGTVVVVVVVVDVVVGGWVVGGIQSGSGTTLQPVTGPTTGFVWFGHHVPRGAVGCGSVCAPAEATTKQPATVAIAARTAETRRRRDTWVSPLVEVRSGFGPPTAPS